MRRTIAAVLCALSLAAPAAAETLLVGNKGEDTLSVIALTSGEELARLPTGKMPHEIAISPDGKLVATSNIASDTISLFDAETRAPLKTIKVSGEAAKGQVSLLFSADSKRLYAAETGHDKVAEIDVASGAVLRRIAAGKNGDGLAIAP